MGEVVLVEDAGHWPWVDRPDLIDRIASFLEES
jgi:pimeloyl-ACP methyl ester carboxylesterase